MSHSFAGLGADLDRSIRPRVVIKKVDDEYQVRWMVGNKIDEAKTYYTDDKSDAEGAKREMERQIKEGVGWKSNLSGLGGSKKRKSRKKR